MKRVTILTLFLLALSAFGWAKEYPLTGMVMKVDAPNKTVVVSCQRIPGYMEAMVMPFDVRDDKNLIGLAPGMAISFTLITDSRSSYADHIQIRRYESVEQDPLTARRLKLLNQLSHPHSTGKPLDIGQSIPDFTLTDQNHHRVKFSQFAGKVVALNFIYTSCALPNFCFRNSNTFGVLQKRFRDRMGRDLILLTVTFDPQRDQPEILAKYAKTWKADSATWHFLTGSVPEIRRVSNFFGVDYFPDEGLMNHSLHTAVIDQRGRLVANIEGNQFTADQLGDLVQTVLSRKANGDSWSQARLTHNSALSSRSTR